MFELYTEKARRVIFFARYEASQFGSSFINTEHLLLGLVREDHALARRVFPQSFAAGDAVRRQIEQRTPTGRVPGTENLPLSLESRHVLAYAAEEAARLKNSFISPDHLLLGLLREKGGLAAEILAPLRLDSRAIAEAIQEPAHGSSGSVEGRSVTAAAKYLGKYRGEVIANMDPQQLGRIQTRVPEIGGKELNWATPCVPYPASGIPTLAVPAIGTSVWIEFEGGNLEYPIWSGCFWEPGQTPLLRLP